MQQKASNIKGMLSEPWLQEIDPHILSYIRASHCMYTLHLHLVKKHGPFLEESWLGGLLLVACQPLSCSASTYTVLDLETDPRNTLQ